MLHPRQTPTFALSKIAIGLLGSFGLLAPVMAQVDNDELPTVSVTSTKVDEQLLDSPNAISVLSADQIEDLRIRSLEDISRFVPNFKLDSGYGAGTRGFLSIRGLGNSPGSIDPSASVYIDDIPYHDFNTYTQALFDVDQIEVLKGSQGTLYGGFSQAGVVDVRTVLPGKELRRKASIDLFTPGNARTTLGVSGAVSDRLSLGVALLDERGEAQFKNVTLGRRSDREQNAIRLQGVLDLSSSSQLLVTLLHHRQRNDGGSDYLPVDRAQYNSFADVDTGEFEIANNIEGFQNVDTSAQSVRFVSNQSGVEYTLIAANRSTKVSSLLDFNYRPNDLGFLFASNSDDESTNQHLEARVRFLPNSAQSIDWTLGASLMRQDYTVRNTVNLGPADFDVIDADGSNQSLFVNGKLPLNESGLSLLAGARYEQAERSGQNGPSVFRPVALGAVPFTQVDTNQATWKVGLSQITERGMIYSHIATGWRPGGVNYYTDNLDFLTFEKERSTTFEVGYKEANTKLAWSGALFFTRVADYQETLVGGAQGTGYLDNVATVHIPGFELDASYILSPAFKISGGFGYAQARFEEYPQFARLEGQALGNRPDWNLNLGTQYKSNGFTYALGMTGTDGFQSAYTPTGVSTKVDGHLIFNSSIAYQLDNSTITGFVENIENEEYFLNAGYYNYGFPFITGTRGQAGSPRVFGVKYEVMF